MPSLLLHAQGNYVWLVLGVVALSVVLQPSILSAVAAGGCLLCVGSITLGLGGVSPTPKETAMGVTALALLVCIWPGEGLGGLDFIRDTIQGGFWAIWAVLRAVSFCLPASTPKPGFSINH